MIAGSASNWLPPAMFFLQLNLSGVIILLSLMFYVNALGESLVGWGGGHGWGGGSCCVFSPLCVMCGHVLWFLCATDAKVRRRGFTWCVVCFLSTRRIFAFLWTPACVTLIISWMHLGLRLMEITRGSWHIRGGGLLCSWSLCFCLLDKL